MAHEDMVAVASDGRPQVRALSTGAAVGCDLNEQYVVVSRFFISLITPIRLVGYGCLIPHINPPVKWFNLVRVLNRGVSYCISHSLDKPHI